MITRDIKIMFGQGLVETTPFCADANMNGEEVKIAGLRMKNLTDAECMGSIDLVFLNKNGFEFFKRKLNEMEENWEKE